MKQYGINISCSFDVCVCVEWKSIWKKLMRIEKWMFVIYPHYTAALFPQLEFEWKKWWDERDIFEAAAMIMVDSMDWLLFHSLENGQRDPKNSWNYFSFCCFSGISNFNRVDFTLFEIPNFFPSKVFHLAFWKLISIKTCSVSYVCRGVWKCWN